ncbi:MAG: hypothetical protein QXE52_08300 [Candidatus Caldarchaeum sp.]
MNNVAKRQVITRQIYIAQPDVSDLYDRLITILRREGKSFNTWVYEQIKEYVARHSEGNPAFTLDTWLSKPDFMAFPTLGEPANARLLAKMDMKTLIELKNNAESWMLNADLAARQLAEHQKHSSFGLYVASCPYCRGDDHG